MVKNDVAVASSLTTCVGGATTVTPGCGVAVGSEVGDVDGETVGMAVSSGVGEIDEETEGVAVGSADGNDNGEAVGVAVGSNVGEVDGDTEGMAVGAGVGCFVVASVLEGNNEKNEYE